MDTRAAQALIRFGLGRRGSEPLPDDPVAWLNSQLDGPDPGQGIACHSGADGLVALREDRTARRARKQGDAAAEMPHNARDVFKADALAYRDYVLATPTPFRERLVSFWANHFTVSLKRGECAPVAHAFVQEAIRPHVTGRFVDMLMAVMHHPAMLLYLDNAQSVGPDSPVGQRSHRGLNENLARECLELHTVSPAAGYTQADVTAFAKVLTGWSIALEYNPPGFLFRLNTHEPGPKTVMGQTFEHGAGGGLAALAWLADHPATHRHLATKLVRHFVADDPPADAVAKIEGVLRNTRGDLKAASRALVALPAAWQNLAKLRSPADYVVAVLRALDLPSGRLPDAGGVLAGLGQPYFQAPLPNGWPDTAQDWASPEALLRRVDWAYAVAGRAGDRDAMTLAADTLGPLAQDDTLEAVRRAGSRRDALALLLSSPEFQRR